MGCCRFGCWACVVLVLVLGGGQLRAESTSLPADSVGGILAWRFPHLDAESFDVVEDFWSGVYSRTEGPLSPDTALRYVTLSVVLWSDLRGKDADGLRRDLTQRMADDYVEDFLAYPGEEASAALLEKMKAVNAEAWRLLRWHHEQQDHILVSDHGRTSDVQRHIRESLAFGDPPGSGYLDQEFRNRLSTHHLHTMLRTWWWMRVVRYNAIDKQKDYFRCYAPSNYAYLAAKNIPPVMTIRRRAVSLRTRLAELPLGIGQKVGPEALYRAVNAHLMTETLDEPMAFDAYEDRLRELMAAKEEEVMIIDGSQLRDFTYVDGLDDLLE